MNFAVQELQNALKSLPDQQLGIGAKREQTTTEFIVPLIDILPFATAISLLIEISARIKGIVDELAELAEFKPAIDEQIKQSHTSDKTDDDTMKVLQKVQVHHDLLMLWSLSMNNRNLLLLFLESRCSVHSPKLWIIPTENSSAVCRLHPQFSNLERPRKYVHSVLPLITNHLIPNVAKHM